MIVYGLIDPRTQQLRYVGQTVRTLTDGPVTVQWGVAKPFDFTSKQLEEANL